MKSRLVLLALSLCTSLAFAQDVVIKDAWVRSTVGGQKATGAFMTITSKSGGRLIAASSPVAGVTEVHEMKMEGGVMTMRPVAGGLELPPGKPVALTLSGYHVMLMDLKAQLVNGNEVPISLTIKSTKGVENKVEVKAKVFAVSPAAADHAKPMN